MFVILTHVVFAGDDGFTVIDSLDAVRAHAAIPGAKIRLKPGTYTLDAATSRHFIVLSGAGAHWDFRGVKLRIDTALFAQRLPPPSSTASAFYCAISITGERITLEGLTTENIGDRPGFGGRNKILNIAAPDVIVRDVEITTSGSAPWGFGSLFGIAGGDVRKMNGIRIGWPARNVQLLRARVHMRAMGHGIFIQGAQDTLIDDCHVDGLLRPTNEILAEKSGYAFAHGFKTAGSGYVEGVSVGPDGQILPGEIIALSEDGIRLYDRAAAGQPTGRTTIRNCTVMRMRRGFCTGLGPGADTLINCEARDCVAAGFNLGGGDVLENSRADAHYSEAVCLPYFSARGAKIDLEILDSRGGQANDLLAVLNGRDHRVRLWTRQADFVPTTLAIAVASTRGYAFYQRSEGTRPVHGIELTNETPARVSLSSNATANRVTSRGEVENAGGAEAQNVVQHL